MASLKRATVYKSGCDMIDQVVLLAYGSTPVREGRWLSILMKDPWYIFILMG